jgi:hypothetical protein
MQKRATTDLCFILSRICFWFSRPLFVVTATAAVLHLHEHCAAIRVV